MKYLILIFGILLFSACANYKSQIKLQLKKISHCFENKNEASLVLYMDTIIADYFIVETDSMRKDFQKFTYKFGPKGWKIKGDSKGAKVYKGSSKGTKGYTIESYFENKNGSWKMVCYFIYGQGVIGSCFGSDKTKSLKELGY